MFRLWLTRSFPWLSFEMDSFDVQKLKYPDEPTKYDLYMITGSRASAYDGEEYLGFNRYMDVAKHKLISRRIIQILKASFLTRKLRQISELAYLDHIRSIISNLNPILASFKHDPKILFYRRYVQFLKNCRME